MPQHTAVVAGSGESLKRKSFLRKIQESTQTCFEFSTLHRKR